MRPFASAVALAALVDGAFVALCAVAVHQAWWGLALAWVATVAVAWLVPAGWTTRVPFCVGWVAVVWRAMTPRSTGSYVVASDTPGYALLALGLVLILLTSATLPLRLPSRWGRPDRPDRPDHPDRPDRPDPASRDVMPQASDSGSGDAR